MPRAKILITIPPAETDARLTMAIRRLEAATSRLEDMATSVDATHPDTVAAINSASASQGIAAAAATAIAAPTATEPTPPPTEPIPRSVEEFDKIVKEDVQAFATASEQIGGLVEQQAKAVLQAFEAERTYLLVSTRAKKPTTQPPELLTELHRYTGTVDELREANRPSPFFAHLSAISEGIVALGWIVESRPADFVTDTLGGAQFYGNRVLKEYKDKERSHTEYIQAYYRIFRALIAYIKEHFPNGLTWNNKDGIDALEALKEIQTGSRAVPTAGAGAPLPPPPPPPPLPLPAIDGTADSTSKSSAKGGDMSAVFDQLNQGSSVTAGLRKVDKSEMTHKNPSLRAGAAVPQRSDSQGSVSSSTSRGKSPVPSKKPKPESMRTKKPPRKELDGNKWIVENFDNTGSEVIEIEGQLSHSILISRCTKCVIKVTGKANAISIDNCTGLSILVESLVSSLDVIKSPKFQVQVDGVVPTILLDQVDSATIYLSAESMTTEVFTSKSSSVNIVLLPKSETEGDDKECAIPEQIRSVVKNGAVVSEIVEHAG